MVQVSAFFPRRVTIHVGDAVTFRPPTGLHTVDLPPRGGQPLPFITRSGRRIARALYAAGTPFWLNGRPDRGFNPALMAATRWGARATYDGTRRVESGLPLAARPRSFTVTFTAGGTFRVFCDVHHGMRGVVRVVARGR